MDEKHAPAHGRKNPGEADRSETDRSAPGIEKTSWDAVVVGAGPAGLAAALMLGRARREVLVIDSGSPRNRFASHMHGVLGNEGVPPAEFAAKGRREAEQYGIRFESGLVTQVETAGIGLRVTLKGGVGHEARALIVASGIADELPGIPGLAEHWGTGVLHCPYCHGWEVAGRRLGVLATSPASLHQARMVRQWSDRVVFFSAGAGPLDPAEEARLRSRGIEIVASPVVEVSGDEDRLSSARTEDGRLIELDAIFTAAEPRPHDDFLQGLDLERTELPFVPGSFLAVDPTGRTSHERVWAVGNVVNPMANVPMSIGAGSFAGAAVNGALIEQEFDDAVRSGGTSAGRPQSPAEFWEERYADADRVWSGRVNRVLADTASALEPGTALDLGCGEGGDAIWLAQQGWIATGVDLSPTAIERARAAAAEHGVAEDALRLETGDLAEWAADRSFDLVTCSFLQSWPVEIPRKEILRRATGFVAPGGHLLITAHAAAPSWAEQGEHGAHGHDFPSPASDLEALDLDPSRWEVLACELRDREASGPDGLPASLTDSVVLVRRLA